MKTTDLLKPLLVADFVAHPPLNPLVGAGLLMAQDSLWVNGNQLLEFNFTDSQMVVCALPTGQDYNGATAQYAQNAQYDENGELLFFIVDGKIYDHAGYLMADNDATPNCTDCLMKGIQEVSIVLVPGTCDKYYIISADSRIGSGSGGANESMLGFSILDLSMNSRYHTGRKGAVWHEGDLTATFANLAPRAGNISGLTGPSGHFSTFSISNGNWPFPGGAFDTWNWVNIHHTVLDSLNAAGDQVLLFHTATAYGYANITSTGITAGNYLATVYNSGADANLYMTGGMAVAHGPNNWLRMAGTANYSTAVNGNNADITLELYRLQASGSTLSATPISTSINTNIYNHVNNMGITRGVAFSPNGRYLYFSQPFPPYIGYIDVTDPALTVHDLDLELNIPGNLASYGTGQIACNRQPGQGTNGHAMYFPCATGMGYLAGPDNPATATWHATLVGNGPGINTPPTSYTAWNQGGGFHFTQYLMDKQNYRDQQLHRLRLAECCQDNERIPEWSHPYTFNGTNTFTNPWTPEQNPLTGPLTCPPAASWPDSLVQAMYGHVYFQQDFTFQTGARVYVKNMDWRFAPNARLIIEPGAFVQFDNCLIKGSVDTLQCKPRKWPGVELRGTPTMAQGTSGYPPNQGRMVFRNSLLQDAAVGVTVGKKNQYGVVQYAGGILETSGSTFRNCRVGVNFYPYQNYLPNNSPTRNRSKFVRTTFTADPNYILPLDFSIHAQFWKVDGIEFLGCTFQNLRTTESNSSQLGQGIRSLDAHFIVKAGCSLPPNTPPPCLPPYLVPTRFTGLDMGIRAATATTTRNFTVDEAEFANNVCGVYANSVLNFEVHNSNFQVGSSKATNLSTQPDEQYWIANGNWAHRGIYSYKSYGFLVDDNTLTNNPGATTIELEGIVTGYSGAHNDVVFRNHASHLEAAYVGEGVCADTVNTSYLGLWYLCNTNNDNGHGLFSRRDISPGHAQNSLQTIRLYQGSPSRVADNTFGQVNGQLDMANSNFTTGNTNNPLTYWWASPQVPYWPQYTSAGVSSTNQDANGNYLVRHPQNCASRVLLVIEEPPDSVDLQGQYRSMAQASKEAYGNTRYLYDQLIDGGNTDAAVQAIASTWPSEAWELREALLARSPFLSNEVLYEVVEKNIMPPAMVAEICVANPDATKKEGFLDWLQYEAPCAMPLYLIDNIEASWETKTYRTTLESTMAYHHGEMTQALGLALATYHADTLVEQVDSIRATWKALPTPAARMAEVLTYVQQDRFDQALALLEQMPAEFKLEAQATGEVQRTKQYVELVQGWRSTGRSEAELNAAELEALRSLRDGGYDLPGEWAQNILCFGYADCRPPRSGGESAGSPKSLPQAAVQSVQAGPQLGAFPNPAGAWTTVQYDLKARADQAYLCIRDVTGKEWARLPVERPAGQSVWDTRAVAPGAYSAELVNAGHIVATVKLIVQP